MLTRAMRMTNVGIFNEVKLLKNEENVLTVDFESVFDPGCTAEASELPPSTDAEGA